MSGWFQVPSQIQQILTLDKQTQVTLAQVLKAITAVQGTLTVMQQQALQNSQTMTAALNKIATAINSQTVTLAKIVNLLTPHDKFRILIGGKPAMALNIVHDADHETLSIQPMKADGTPDVLDPSVVVTWATVTDPSATPPSFSLTPNPDNQTAVLKQLGQDVVGCVISASAMLPGAAAAEVEQATFNIVATADTFKIVFGTEAAN